jgi:uncharacterized OsmC-like protein
MSIRSAVEAAVGYVGSHPDEARYRDSVASARLDESLTVVVADPSGREVRTDMSTGIGGGDAAPSPGWLLRAAIASCVATLIALRAAVVGVELHSLRVDVDSESDDRGILGLDDAVPAGPLSIRVAVALDSDAPGRAAELVDWALVHCPVTDAVARPVPVEVVLLDS